MTSFAGRVFDALPAPLARAAFRGLQLGLSFRAPQGVSDDDLPLPPPYLRVLTAGTADAEAFQSLGRNGAAEILSLATQCGLALDGARILEFGVGCGRIARYLIRLAPGATFSGCDINSRLLRWARAHLPGDYTQTALEPPLPYAAGQFDLVYSVSVFTHLHEAQARRWLKELARVVKSGGLAVLTHHDEHLPQAEPIRAGLLRDGFAILREGAEGSNLLSTYLTRDGFAERAAPEWTLMHQIPSHASATGQAVIVLKRV